MLQLAFGKKTQHEIAKRLKKPQSFVAKYEDGERCINVVEFLAITSAIGADPANIVRASTGKRA